MGHLCMKTSRDTDKHARLHVSIHPSIHVCMHACMHAYKYIYIYMCVCVYIYIYMYAYLWYIYMIEGLSNPESCSTYSFAYFAARSLRVKSQPGCIPGLSGTIRTMYLREFRFRLRAMYSYLRNFTDLGEGSQILWFQDSEAALRLLLHRRCRVQSACSSNFRTSGL